MQNKLVSLFLISFLLAKLLSAQEQKVKIVSIAFYNIENLFDTIDDPEINDAEFLPGGVNRWNSEKYFRKLNNIASVISQIGDDYGKGGPVIIGLSEIENRRVLEDLCKTKALKSLNYGIAHIDGPDRRGVDVALLYRKNYFIVTKSISARLAIPGMENFYTRDQLVVSGILDGEPMHFIVNHWPSRRGGEKRSAPLREAAAKLTRHLSDSLHKSFSNAKVIIMGDFNDNPTDASIVQNLKAMSDTNGMKYTCLYNPYNRLFKKQGTGTLGYRDNWSLFDQIILSQPFLTDKNGYRFHTARVFNRPSLLQKEGAFAGYPWRTYVGNNYTGGFSDHLPVYIYLVK